MADGLGVEATRPAVKAAQEERMQDWADFVQDYEAPTQTTTPPAEPETEIVDIAALDKARDQAVLAHLAELGGKGIGNGSLSGISAAARRAAKSIRSATALHSPRCAAGMLSLLANNGIEKVDRLVISRFRPTSIQRSPPSNSTQR